MVAVVGLRTLPWVMLLTGSKYAIMQQASRPMYKVRLRRDVYVTTPASGHPFLKKGNYLPPHLFYQALQSSRTAYINIKNFRMEIFTLIPLLRIACVEKRGVWRTKKPTV